MEAHGQRALVLHDRGRYAQAAEEVRAELAANPNDPRAHILLALCNAKLKKDRTAMDAALRAIALAPDEPFIHFALAGIHFTFGRYDKALAAASEAVRLDPAGADYHALVGQIHLVSDRFAEALAATDRALALDPQHVDSLIHRSMALAFLGRTDEARETSARALSLAPENDQAHVAAGRALLHAGDSESALVHFREALRLDPNSESARLSFVEALKARHRVYRWMLLFFLWIGRQSTAIRWGVVIALIVGRNALRVLSREFPAIAPLAMPLAVALGLLLLFTWIANPLFTFLLRFDPVGRHALGPRNLAVSNYLVTLVAFLMFFGIAAALGVRGDALSWILMLGLLALPASQFFSYPSGPQRRPVAVFCGTVVAVGAAALALYILSLDAAAAEIAFIFLVVGYGIGCLVSVAITPQDERAAGRQ